MGRGVSLGCRFLVGFGQHSLVGESHTDAHTYPHRLLRSVRRNWSRPVVRRRARCARCVENVSGPVKMISMSETSRCHSGQYIASVRAIVLALCAIIIPAFSARAQINLSDPRWLMVSPHRGSPSWIDTTRIRIESGKPVVWLATQFTPPSASSLSTGDSLRVSIQHISIDCSKLSWRQLSGTMYYTSGASRSLPGPWEEEEAVPGTVMEIILKITCIVVRKMP